MGLEVNETYFQVSRDGWLYQAYPKLFTLNIFSHLEGEQIRCGHATLQLYQWMKCRGFALPCIMFVCEPYLTGKHSLTNQVIQPVLKLSLIPLGKMFSLAK